MTLEHIAAEINRVSRLTGEFKLRSGDVSNTYFDKYLFESDPKLLRQIAAQMVDLVPDGTEILAGLEMGGIPVVTALSAQMALPASFVRKEAKAYGTSKHAEGPALTGRKICIVEDVVSSGGAILDAVAKLRADSVEVYAAVCVIDRETGAAENLLNEGIELRPLLRMVDL